MPKHRKQRGRVNQTFGRKTQPIVDEGVRQSRVLPVISQLKSTNASERLIALNAIVDLIKDRNIRHMLLRERMIKIILTDILSDVSLEITSYGIEVLRDVVLEEGHDPAKFLLRENVQRKINNLSSKAISTITQGTIPSESSEFKLLNDTCERVFGLVAAISMNEGFIHGVDNAVNLGLLIIDKNSSASFFSPKCVETAFEMIYYLSEESEPELSTIIDENTLIKLQQASLVMESASWSTKIYALGTKVNLHDLNLIDTKSINRSAEELSDYLLAVPISEERGVCVCLELLAILAQTDDLSLVSTLVDKIMPILTENLLKNPAYQLDAIAVLNNLGWSLNALEQRWEKLAQRVYEITMTTCFNQLDNAELVYSSLGLIGATLVQDVSYVDTLNFKELVMQLLSLIDSLYGSQEDDGWVSLSHALVLVLGSEGLPAVRLGLIDPTSRLIFLILEKSSNVKAQVDVLNSLFDLFADNEAPYNQAEYNDKHLNEKLKELKPSLKRSLKSPPKSDPELREQALDALTNLDNFIAYKQSS